MTVKVIGVGNSFRRDDGVGRAVARILREAASENLDIVESSAEPSELMANWRSADTVILVDAAAAASAPGKISRFTIGETNLAADAGGASTHGFGVAAAIGLAEALGERPVMMTVFTIEGADFGYGEGLSKNVAAALPQLVDRVIAEANRLSIKDTTNA